MTTAISLPQHTVHGEGGTTVFLLHGAYGGADYFDNAAKVVSDAGYRVVVWNAPGYGGTELPAGATIAGYAESLRALVQAVGTDTNVVLGHSMGALIAPLATNAEPAIHGLVLSSASAGFASRTPEDQKRYLAERLEPIENGMSVAEYVRPLLVSMMGPGASGPLVEHVREVIVNMSTATLASSIRAIAGYDGRPALAALTVPTLLLAGTEDTACPVAGMRKIHDMVPGSEIHELEGVGHYGFAESPDEYLGHLLDFLGRNFPATPAKN
ncbi:alpha/beta hydrolase [Rhodococcus sp. PAMC28707]|uniref:alpha/beta fold hydrolase n=1 Tax=unclassified Rhodococcus (in: high G+C Gram-positive bacteria) TaxID=192944 RepID=UPI00109D9908|nr:MULTISPECIES: alpha/beta hydrolase [unclassified Rhodococcus (in: high G+C Gram-positive bacteria)]QCB51592.1 alpha/beta hydrolase [Rhodococcus sp. PAMC28705]QCB60240.1 alpha/beta hydrolase [Rhodococcus sp. PAMC28707]